jgi:hypothetical protein
MNQFPTSELKERLNMNASHFSAAQLVTGKLLPSAYFEHLKFVTNHEQTISDFCQHSIQTVREDEIVMKARVKKLQFLRVQDIVKVRRAYNTSHYIRLNPHGNSILPAPQLARNCMLLFVFLLSDEAS